MRSIFKASASLPSLVLAGTIFSLRDITPDRVDTQDMKLTSHLRKGSDDLL
uniref:Uncharacterized protein n=1 Tax=Physcomitrium patens TaxID=3218 RepID=A0A2K1KC35_PHYPA|nr:hypothetical protein PHYPA_010526 [Physcomitrium patens]